MSEALSVLGFFLSVIGAIILCGCIVATIHWLGNH